MHIAVIVGALFIGLFFSPWAVLAIVFLHRLHIWFFDGCLISRLQKFTGGLPENMDFLQLASEKIFGKNIDSRQSQHLDYLFSSLAILITFLK